MAGTYKYYVLKFVGIHGIMRLFFFQENFLSAFQRRMNLPERDAFIDHLTVLTNFSIGH